MAGIRDTIGVFVRNRPSLSALLASRTRTFGAAHCVLPSDAVAGDPVTGTVQTWDRHERLLPLDGSFEVDSTDPAATVPERVSFAAEDGGVTALEGVTFETPGVQYLELRRGGQRFASNPVLVHSEAPDLRTYWGDIHLHSQFSDGAGSVEKGVAFGRDVMDLDVVAYTDHDTMGFFIPPTLQRRRMRRRYFDRMKEITETFNDPGEFVTLFGYEWTKQPNKGGHVNVYFEDVTDAELFDSISEETDTYEKLWSRLRRFRDEVSDVLTIPHHPAEAMYPFDFAATEYDEEMAPLVEVYSQWGSSEQPGSEGNRFPLGMGQGEVDEPGHYVQDALRMGHRVGLMASSDFHGPAPGHSLIHADPHFPGLGELLEDGIGWGHIWRVWAEQSYPGGLVAFRAPELTRSAVFKSLRRRRVYGTAQPHRILVDFSVAGVEPGEADSTATVRGVDAGRPVSVRVAGTAPVERVTVVKNNEPWREYEGATDPGAGIETYVVDREYTDDDPIEGMAWDENRGTEADVYYLRVQQAGGGAAWAGPVWVGVAE